MKLGWGGGTQGSREGGPQGLLEQEPQPAAIFCAQEKSLIEVFLRPLDNNAYALVFFSRRTDMPYRFHCSLSQLNFTSSILYEVSALCFPGRALLGRASPRPPLRRGPWVLWQVLKGQLQALRPWLVLLCTLVLSG